MMKAFLWGCGLVPALLLAGCQSEQKLLLPETTAYSSPCPSTSDSAFSVLPATTDSAALLASPLPFVSTRGRQKSASNRAQFLTVSQAPRALQLSRRVAHTEEITQLRRAHRQSFHFRQPQDETEGNPWLVALGVVLVAAGIVGGLLIGGGLGIFAGIVVGLFGYYFFMRGLLGPHAWLEAIQELFQL